MKNTGRKLIMGSAKREKLLLFLVVAAAFWLRIYNIDHHLRGGLAFEEPAYIGKIMAHDLPRVKIFNYPPFYQSFMSGVNRIYFLSGFLRGDFKEFADLTKAFSAEYSPSFSGLILTHRVVTAAVGTLTVPVLFLAARTLFGAAAGLCAALLLAVLPLHVCTSSTALGADNLQLLFLTTALLFICRILKEGQKRRDYLLAGLFVGLAAATKYFGIFGFVPLLCAHFLSEKKAGNKLLFLSITTAAAAMAVTSLPVMALNAGGVARTIGFFIENYTRPVSSYITVYHALSQKIGWISCPQSLVHGLGPGLFFLAACGFALCIFRRSRTDLVMASFPAALYVFIGGFYAVQVRYILPAVPFLIMIATGFMAAVLTKTKGRAAAVVYAAVCLLAIPSLKESIYFKQWIHQESVEGAAKKWAVDAIPADSSVLIDGDDLGDDGLLQPFLFCGERVPFRDVVIIDWKKPADPAAFFEEKKFDYVIIDSTRAVIKKMKPLYTLIGEKYSLIREFKPKFPTPGYHSLSIYGILYNHSFRIYKKRGM